MTYTLDAELEARLKERPLDEGENLDLNETAQMIIRAWLDWEAEDMADAIEGIKRGQQAVAEGRTRPLSEFIAAQRKKYGRSAEWPHNTKTENDNAGC